MKKNIVSIIFFLGIIAVITSGCMEQYSSNPQLNALYRVLNYDTTYKERALLFEMEDHTQLTRDGKFYIMGAGISNPGAYSCNANENIISAIGKAGQTASYSEISFTLIKGIRENEREIRGIVIAANTSNALNVEPGDLICLNTHLTTIALSQK